MDKPGPRSYEVIQLFLELWERKKGEQAAMLARPPEGSDPSTFPAKPLSRFRVAELSPEGEDSEDESPGNRTGQAQ